MVSVFFSDYGAESGNIFCPRIIVQAVESRVHDKSPAELVRRNNPCAVSPASLHAAIDPYRKGASVLEAISFGIVAQCGQSSVSLGLPIDESLDMEKMKAVHPEVAALWTLTADVTSPVFGENDIFHERSEQENAVLQSEGARLVPELVSGRYDIGLGAAEAKAAFTAAGNAGTHIRPSRIAAHN